MERYGKDRLWPFAEGGGSTLALFTGAWALFAAMWMAQRNRATTALLVAATALWLTVLYFFRDPNRPLVTEPGVVMSPADGKVVEIVREKEALFLHREMLRISTFLDLTDVHVQRVPIGGTVRRIVPRPGKFLQAFRPEASAENESIAMEVETPYGLVLVKQIAGIMARRCVNYATPGQQLVTGQRFGLIRFGSRVDLFLPPEAEPLVAEGARVFGAMTPFARLVPLEGRADA